MLKESFINEFIRMRKEGLVVYFAVLCLHLCGGSEEKTANLSRDRLVVVMI